MHFGNHCIFDVLLLRTLNKYTEEFDPAPALVLVLAVGAVLENDDEPKPVEYLPVAGLQNASVVRWQ